ncbi:ATP-binding protein [Pseudomonas sp. NPDC090202]|uniref:ATP-binding protein n=1 Tax=Pseudomonas sp. NPDC090202 TaxID=3364476 RepID=UPI00380A1A08
MIDEADNATELTYTFGPFHFIPARKLLLKASPPVRLGSRALSVLNALVERPGELISNAELSARAWPDSAPDDDRLNTQIAALREALGDGYGDDHYVTGVAQIGYRFVAPVAPRHSHRLDTEHLTTPSPLHNLPPLGAEPVGRAQTVRLLQEHLRHDRLVTLVGPGGIGKTTVALTIARASLGEYEHGVWLLDIGALRDPHALAGTLATALDLTFHSADPLPVLIKFLQDKHLLIILDSCEHLIDAAAALAEHLLAGAPDVVLLATSREPLRFRGERVEHLPALLTPPPGSELSAASTQAYSSVQLFVKRARASLESFELTDENAALIVDICRKLDGIALAIELTASRVGTFSLPVLLSMLDNRFRLLHQERRSILPRHRSLAAALEWSHETLTGNERIALRRIALFTGGFSFEAAHALTGLDAVSAIESIDGLVAKSLLTVESKGIELQYRLLDTTRSYALQKLEESGEFSLWQRKHAEYCRDLFIRAEAEWSARNTSEWTDKYRLRLGDVRDVLNWAFSAEGDVAIGIALTVAVIPLWMHQSMLGELNESVSRALASQGRGYPLADRELMKLHAARGATLMYTQGLAPEIDAAWTQTLQVAQRLSDSEYQLRALWGLAAYRVYIGNYQEGLQLLERFETIAVRRKDTAAQMDCDRLVATALHYLGEQDLARQHLDNLISDYVPPPQRSRMARFQLDQHVAARVLLSNIQWLQGQPDQAVQTARSALNDALSTDHALSICNALVLAHCPVSLYVGNLDEARRGLTLLFEHQLRYGLVLWNDLARCLEGTLLILQGNCAGVTHLQQAIDELCHSRFGMRYPYFLGVLASGYGALGDRSRARDTIQRAIKWCSQHEEHWCIAELLRIKGDLLVMEGATASLAAAEDCYLKSLEWSRRQRLLAWQLRTAISLARFWQKRGACSQAESLLTSTYALFEEGFDNTDLQAAKALIRALRDPSGQADYAGEDLDQDDESRLTPLSVLRAHPLNRL